MQTKPILTAFSIAASFLLPNHLEAAADLLKRSDVILSPRFRLANWQQNFISFNATRISWTYAGTYYGPLGQNFRFPVAGNFEFWVPATHPQAAAMMCYDAAGKVIPTKLGTKPDGSPNYLYRPNVDSSAWRTYALEKAKELVDVGITSFQQDDVSLNAAMEPQGGCYMNGKRSNQKTATTNYLQWMRASLQAYANAKRMNKDIVLSGNITNHQVERSAWLNPFLNHYISEFYPDLPTPMENAASLLELARFTRGTPDVSALTIASNSETENLRALASTYALGLTAIAPWNVYVGPPPLTRYDGDPRAFSGLFGIVRNNPALFDDYTVTEDGHANTATLKSGMGYVTAVEDIGTAWRVIWSRKSSFLSIAKGRPISINGVSYNTISASNVGNIIVAKTVTVKAGDVFSLYGPPPSIVSVTSNAGNLKIAHFVNWDKTPRLITIGLKKSGISYPPRRILLSTGQKRTVEPIILGDFYIYPNIALPLAGWAVLAP